MKKTLGILRANGVVVSNATGKSYNVGALCMAGEPIERDSKRWNAFLLFFPRSVWITDMLADGSVRVEL